MYKRLLAVLAVAALVLMVAIAPVAQDKRDISIVNKSGEPITEVYISLSDDGEWGEDVLGVDVLENGQGVDIHFSGYGKSDCLFDVLAKNGDGDQWLLEELNLCEVSTVTITGKFIKAK